jgi:hypothetical protein
MNSAYKWYSLNNSFFDFYSDDTNDLKTEIPLDNTKENDEIIYDYATSVINDTVKANSDL